MRESITYREMRDPPEIPWRYGAFSPSPKQKADALVAERRQRLIDRSGVFNTTAGEILTYEDVANQVYVMEARFNSSAWTGRSRTPRCSKPHPLVRAILRAMGARA